MRKGQLLLSCDIEAIAQATAERILDMDDKVLTLQQMAEKLGRSPEAVRKLVQRNKLPCHRVDNKLYFSDRETTKYLLSK